MYGLNAKEAKKLIKSVDAPRFSSNDACMHPRLSQFRKSWTPMPKLEGRGRVITKNGSCNIKHENIPQINLKYFRDFFNSFIAIRWPIVLLLFSAAYILSWIFFAVLYFLILLAKGDFDYDPSSPNFIPCVWNIEPYSFTSVFLFSVETQHTIGYGNRFISEECPGVIFVFCFQSILGVIIQTCMAGIILAKLMMPSQRTETIIFSENAVVAMRNGKLCFQFRVANIRSSQLIEAHVRLQLIKKTVTMEGEVVPFTQIEMSVNGDGKGDDRLFLVWPITVYHVVDELSPLYKLKPTEFSNTNFEIVAILEGGVEDTSQTVQARTSYVPSEIMWGYRFEKLITYQLHNGSYHVDYDRFNAVFKVDTPGRSARDIDKIKELRKTSFRMMGASEWSRMNKSHVSIVEPSPKASVDIPSQMPSRKPSMMHPFFSLTPLDKIKSLSDNALPIESDKEDTEGEEDVEGSEMDLQETNETPYMDAPTRKISRKFSLLHPFWCPNRLDKVKSLSDYALQTESDKEENEDEEAEENAEIKIENGIRSSGHNQIFAV